MMKTQALAAGILMAALTGPVGAHSNHTSMEPVTQAEASTKAGAVVQNLVTNQKLDNSWKQAKAQRVTEHQTPDGTLWDVQYQNPQEKDAAKQTLHVFIDEMGNVVTANHDGKL